MSMIGIARKTWALRLSIVFICVLLYVYAPFGSSQTGPWVEDGSANWAAAQPLADSFANPENPNSNNAVAAAAAGPVGAKSGPIDEPVGRANVAAAFKAAAVLISSSIGPKSPKEKKVVTDLTKSSATVVTTKAVPAAAVAPGSADDAKSSQTVQVQSSIPIVSPAISLKDAIPCNEKSLESRRAQRGDYWVLYNYVPMSISVKCWESVTYTTHADYTFLDNLEPLLERWRAPISIALHAPGNDFLPTLNAIRYARSCGSPLVSQLVTFHIYFSSKHVPKMIPASEKIINESYNCSKTAPWINATISKMYKSEKKLLYPVNVGRNIARESAVTFYVLASDIELYPSPDLPEKFLEMIRKRDQTALYKPNPKVFVLSIFEVDEKSQPPLNKTKLIQMLKNGTAIPFHKKLCSGCHNVPRSKEWQEAPETEGLHVFHVGKRIGSFIHWEPIFIGTNNDPLYDERLSWEGKSDKMTQGYALCVLDYDFLILDNAFLVHRPGIKIYKKDAHRDMLTAKTNALIKKIIVPELKILYGQRKGCAV